MNGHGVDIRAVNITNGTCPCVGDPTKTTDCIILDLVLNNGKNYKIFLFEDESMSSQSIITYLNTNFSAIKGRASTFSVRDGDHPGYVEFKFKGDFKRISGRIA